MFRNIRTNVLLMFLACKDKMGGFHHITRILTIKHTELRKTNDGPSTPVRDAVSSHNSRWHCGATSGPYSEPDKSSPHSATLIH